ncbi:DUF484 family protein [Cellvibrio japonicus]|uniref:DUF484 domain-containing protein n=1 Tax=Cellvibrio japonicus (strain Ueda107) TaxID=498211 RepID=B3PEI7_CELJU|nr:DUF484 family protein [Cellvibrio japonicus]ACE83023.1 conserved hypothetical protein [Cellvibrio japonicus Ueda107]QEI13548.1 DUF484 family protein [Cellvibrio japonicus]QEI17122.1 DUF484 family protein [Cellvibrio japonicus]QEI20699.1 DUF484 family protein [Cellvibrio japonicus]
MTDTKLPTLADPLEPEQVAAYLQAHPDFFAQHPELLAELSLPHESGAAVSLVERQVAILRERNMDMRHRLSKLLDNARENDKLFDKTKRLVLSLLEGQDMGDVLDALYYSFDKDFGIHFTSVLLFGNPDKIPSSQARIVSMGEAREHIAPLIKNSRAMCGTLGSAELAFIFGAHAGEIGSVATVPLMHGSAFGLLAIGNRDPHYYRSSMGTLFLGYIAEVLNRLLPPHLPR